MQNAYFDNIRSKIVPLLQSAKKEIKIAMAWFTSAELFAEILSCLDRKVKVDLVLLDNPINFMYYAPDFNEYIESGGKLRVAGVDVGFMHHKFCIIDNAIAITGSYNWTYYAESRNIENIVVTDDFSVINLFRAEYDRLSKLIECSTFSPRLSWDDIESRTDVDYRELNYEIEKICQAQLKPIRKVIEAKTVVQVVETKMRPKADKNVGVLADEDIFIPIINANVSLPHTSTKSFFYDSKNERTFICKFICVNPNKIDDVYLIKEADVLQVAQGTSNLNLKIEISITLDVNGSLRIDVNCPDNGKKLMISALDKKLVRYE